MNQHHHSLPPWLTALVDGADLGADGQTLELGTHSWRGSVIRTHNNTNKGETTLSKVVLEQKSQSAHNSHRPLRTTNLKSTRSKIKPLLNLISSLRSWTMTEIITSILWWFEPWMTMTVWNYLKFELRLDITDGWVGVKGRMWVVPSHHIHSVVVDFLTGKCLRHWWPKKKEEPVSVMIYMYLVIKKMFATKWLYK